MHNRGYNTWVQVSAVLKNVLEGRQVHDLLPNPDAVEGNPMLGARVTYGLQMAHSLSAIKNFFMANDARKKVWRTNTYDLDEAHRLGGLSRSDAQRAARVASLAKAREVGRVQQKAEARDRADSIMALVQEGLTKDQLAERLGIALASVDRTVGRARDLLGLRLDQTTAAAPEHGFGLDDFVALLSAS